MVTHDKEVDFLTAFTKKRELAFNTLKIHARPRPSSELLESSFRS